MMTCVCKQHEGTHVVRIVVPAKGYDLDKHTPLTTWFLAHLCEACAHEHGRALLVDDVFRSRVRFAVAAAGRVTPDFDRASYDLVPVDDPAAVQAFDIRGADA